MEKLAIRNQKNLAIKTRPTVLDVVMLAINILSNRHTLLLLTYIYHIMGYLCESYLCENAGGEF